MQLNIESASKSKCSSILEVYAVFFSPGSWNFYLRHFQLCKIAQSPNTLGNEINVLKKLYNTILKNMP